MNRNEELLELRTLGLLPFQAAAVLELLRPNSERVWEIASPVGTGKTRLGAVVVQKIARNRKDVRVLVIVPRPLVMQWVDVLRDRGQDAMAVDRRRFVELLAAAGPGEPVWPLGSTVMSIDFANRADISEALLSVPWQLVIADESHLLAGKRSEALVGLLNAGRVQRALLLTAIPSEAPARFGGNISRRVFTWSDIKDWEGRPLVIVPQSLIEFVMYRRSREELTLLQDLETLSRTIQSEVSALRVPADVLVRAASSSLYAAERCARRLRKSLTHSRNLVAHGRAPEFQTLSEVDAERPTDISNAEFVAELGGSGLTTATPELLGELAVKLQNLLERFDDVGEDTKLVALRHLLSEISSSGQSPPVCIWTAFKATAEYVATALEGSGRPISVLSMAMALEDRARQAERISTGGGILLTGGLAVEGLSLEAMEMCIHYDLPKDVRTLEQRLGPFMMYGRTRPFRNVALRDAAGGLESEEAVFRLLASRGHAAT
jgi:hypothetical protein